MVIETLGAGADVVLIPGIPQPPSDLRSLAERWAAWCRCRLVHLPNYGQSPPGPVEPARVHALLAQQLVELGVRDPIYVGVSVGFWRSMALALHPSAPPCRGLVGLGPVCELAPRRALWRQAADALEQGEDLRELLISLNLSPGFAEANPERRAYVMGFLEACPRASLVAELRAMAAADELLPALAALEVPIALRVGALDAATTPEATEAAVARLGRGEVSVVEGAGHLLDLEDLDATADWVRGVVSAWI